jgi:hypothetical protein
MRCIALALISLLASTAGLAQAPDAPGRVGRLAYAEGGVSMYQDPEQGWEKAYVNSPITSENSLWTDPGARAELRIGGTALRLDEGTQIDLSEIADDALDASLVRGSLNVRMRYKQRAERFAISTPQGRFILEVDGRYRIDADPDGDQSRLTVFAGSAALEASQGSVRVVAGQSIVVHGASSEYAIEAASGDAFDQWALERDDLWRDTATRRYVSTSMTGYEDLDSYGEWSPDADYGALWFPARVDADWAPYRNGRWSYVRPWGWTWIDDEPWGYAPSHYGRWVFVRNRWGWDPGRRIERPAWAPALVGWVGGSGLGPADSPAVIGWYPLAPWERYEPWYRANANYLSRVNIVVLDRAPRQWQGRGDDWRRINRDRATTVVQRDAMLDRRRVQNSLVTVAPDLLRRQPMIAPGQVQQMLPQHNELVRRRAEPVQAGVVPVRRPGTSGAPGEAAPSAAQNNLRRPDFSRRAAPVAPPLAPPNAPPTQARRPGGTLPGARSEPIPPGAAPAADPQVRGNANPAGRVDANAPARSSEQRDTQQREAQQREAQQQQRAARQLQQQQERAQREGQQQQPQQQQQQQQQERATRAAQQPQQTPRAQEAPRVQEVPRVQEAPRAPANPVARGEREKEKEKDEKAR